MKPELFFLPVGSCSKFP